MKGKFDVTGNDVLFYESLGCLESAVDHLQEDIKKLVIDQNFEDLNNVFTSAEKVHSFIGNFFAYLRYRAFELNGVSTTTSAEKSEV